jgi:hypothetical protein
MNIFSSPRNTPSGQGVNPRSLSLSEGFSWSESLRSRAERTSSITAANAAKPAHHHHRALSVADIPPPVREIPRTAPAPATVAAARVPDPFQERILKGDFYMD